MLRFSVQKVAREVTLGTEMELLERGVYFSQGNGNGSLALLALEVSWMCGNLDLRYM